MPIDQKKEAAAINQYARDHNMAELVVRAAVEGTRKECGQLKDRGFYEWQSDIDNDPGTVGVTPFGVFKSLLNNPAASASTAGPVDPNDPNNPNAVTITPTQPSAILNPLPPKKNAKVTPDPDPDKPEVDTAGKKNVKPGVKDETDYEYYGFKNMFAQMFAAMFDTFKSWPMHFLYFAVMQVGAAAWSEARGAGNYAAGCVLYPTGKWGQDLRDRGRELSGTLPLAVNFMKYTFWDSTFGSLLGPLYGLINPNYKFSRDAAMAATGSDMRANFKNSFLAKVQNLFGPGISESLASIEIRLPSILGDFLRFGVLRKRGRDAIWDDATGLFYRNADNDNEPGLLNKFWELISDPLGQIPVTSLLAGKCVASPGVKNTFTGWLRDWYGHGDDERIQEQFLPFYLFSTYNRPNSPDNFVGGVGSLTRAVGSRLWNYSFGLIPGVPHIQTNKEREKFLASRKAKRAALSTHATTPVVPPGGPPGALPGALPGVLPGVLPGALPGGGGGVQYQDVIQAMNTATPTPGNAPDTTSILPPGPGGVKALVAAIEVATVDAARVRQAQEEETSAAFNDPNVAAVVRPSIPNPHGLATPHGGKVPRPKKPADASALLSRMAKTGPPQIPLHDLHTNNGANQFAQAVTPPPQPPSSPTPGITISATS